MELAELESVLEIEDSSAKVWHGVLQRLIINRERIRDLKGEFFCKALLEKVEKNWCWAAKLESLLEIEDSSQEAWCGAFQRLMIINKEEIIGAERGRIFCHALLKKVEEIGCKDKYSVWKIIHIISDWKRVQQICIPDFFPEIHRKIILRNTDVNFNYNIFHMERQLLICLKNSDVEVIRLFLNYGYLYPIDVSTRRKDMMDKLIWLLSRFRRMNVPTLGGHFCYWKCMEKFDNRLELLDPHNFTNVSGCENLRVFQRGFKRILLAALCIGVYADRNTNNPEKSFHCLRLYFRAVADPIVQADEIEELLHFVFFHYKECVDKMVQDIKTLFPESLESYRPRSLKHLCRCAIRQKLTDRPEVYPVLLDRIGLPLKLKTYIMGDM